MVWYGCCFVMDGSGGGGGWCGVMRIGDMDVHVWGGRVGLWCGWVGRQVVGDVGGTSAGIQVNNLPIRRTSVKTKCSSRLAMHGSLWCIQCA